MAISSKIVLNKTDVFWEKNIKTKNFEDLFKIYQQILLITSGDFNKTISLLTDLDKKYNITSSEYGIGNFIEDLKKKGYIIENKSEGEN